MAKKPAAEKPPTEGVLDTLIAFLPGDIDPIVKLFDDKFEWGEVWDALETVAQLGRKAEKFLEGDGPIFGSTASPVVRSVIPAETLSTAEQIAQLQEAVESEQPIKGGAEDGKVAMNPVIAGLLISLAKKVAELLISRLNNK